MATAKHLPATGTLSADFTSCHCFPPGHDPFASLQHHARCVLFVSLTMLSLALPPLLPDLSSPILFPSPLPPRPPSPPPVPILSVLHLARHHLFRLLPPPPPRPTSTDPPSWLYVPPVPNLELHSAAADGNVGLVHYALTHGQPINSVLHGVQPIHAAAAGGSVSAMRMLIERGADVNAPRLPRRYSNEKKRGAPALGAAGERERSIQPIQSIQSIPSCTRCSLPTHTDHDPGATPLHFAAANGHVNIVQMLLTCGAAPNKSDKLGQTPESLAEHNGHEEVVHVLRIFEQLNANGAGAGAAGGTSSASPWLSPAPQAGPSSQSATSPSGSTMDLPSTSTSEAQSVDANGGSRKGKERALSFVSAKSDSSAAVKVKKSLEGIWRKTSRSASMASTSASRPPEEPLPIGEEEEHSRSNTPLPPPSSPPANGTTPHSINLASPPLATSPILSSPQFSQNALDRVISGTSLTSNGDLQRVSSAASGGSAHSSTVVSPAPPPTAPQPAVRERHPSTSSRRPSLPSILEKAAHPGAAFRAAMRRDHEGDHAQAVRFSPDTSPVAEEAPRLGGRFRGRLRSNESGSASAFSSTSSGGSAIHSAQAAAKRYISKHNLSSLFKRSNSPPSRSPSPPKRSELTPINVDQMDEGIERLKRASQDVDAPKARSRSSSFNEGDDAEGLTISPIATPKSAPATKTRFFEDLGVTPPQVTSHSASSSPRSETPQAIAPERTLGRPRTSSGVIAPSPLANEWARDSDSDGSSPRHGIRRARTELLNKTYSGVPPSSLTQQYHVGPGGQGGKQRSNTLPSGAYPPDLPASFQRFAGTNGSGAVGGGLGWQEGAADLRKVATAGQLRESERARAEALEDEDDEVFHDALISVGEPMSREEVPLLQPNSESGLPPVGQLLLDSEEEGDGDGDETTPTGENEEPHYDTHDLSVRVQGRFRGASIGSGTTESSRLATPPGSTVRAASFTSEEGGSERYDSSALGVIGSRRLRVEGKGTMSPPMPSSPMLPMLVTALDTRPSRPRGISTSSTSPTTASASGSGSASGLALSFLQSQSQSPLTPSTSLTPGSAPGGTPGLGFPPVPEHEVASSSSSPSRPSPPVTGRKISSRAEAADLVKQNEDDVLQLAQLPPSLDSSRSLAAQLAAYGESHAIEQEFAKQERKQRRADRRRNSGATADDSSDAASFVSARSAPSGVGGVSAGASGASSGSRRSSEHRLVSSRREYLKTTRSIESRDGLIRSLTEHSGSRPVDGTCSDRRAALEFDLDQQHLRQASCGLPRAHGGAHVCPAATTPSAHPLKRTKFEHSPTGRFRHRGGRVVAHRGTASSRALFRARR